MGRASTASADYPGGAADGRGTIDVGGIEREFQHVSIGNPQCAIEVSEGLEDLDLPAIGPAIESSPAVPEPHQRQLLAGRRARASAHGSSSAGWGRRSPRGPAPAERPSPPTSAVPRAPITVELDGGELEVEIGDDLAIRLTGTAEPVFSGELAAPFVERVGRA